jgi:predicted dehydrogenase
MKPLRVGLIGAGNISKAHMRAFVEHPDRVCLAAVCDVSADAAHQRAAEHGVSSSSVYTDAEKMLREATIDAVDICTTHASHADLTILAASQGRHVLVEKPMATTLGQCRAMIEAADRAGTILMVAQMQRYDPSYRGIRRLVAEGTLGAIRACRLDAMQNLRGYVLPGHWLYDGAVAGGGIVISVMIHPIDLMRYLIGDVRRVTAACRTIDSAFINGAEDYAAGVIEFKNGAIGDLFGTYSSTRHPYSESFYIFGERGTVCSLPVPGSYRGPALVSLANDGPLINWNQQYAGFAAATPDREDLPTEDAFTNEILHFERCCRTGAEPLTSGRDNLRSVAVVQGIYESARAGGVPVDIDQLLAAGGGR